MIHVNNKLTLLFFTLLVWCVVCLCVPFVASAASDPNLSTSGHDFVSISQTPIFEKTGGGINSDDFFTNVYKIAIVIAAVIAVIKLILAGAQYTLSGIVTRKEQAIRDIRSALIGLLIILGAVTLLTTINPQITNMPQLDNIYDKMSTMAADVPQTPQQRRINVICGEENEKCENALCSESTFSENLTPGVIGTITTFSGVELLANNVTCRTWCGRKNGEYVPNVEWGPDSGRCIYPKDPNATELALEEDLSEYIKGIIEKEDMCEEDGCRAVECKFWRWELTCEKWCSNKDGKYIETSQYDTNLCIVPSPIADELGGITNYTDTISPQDEVYECKNQYRSFSAQECATLVCDDRGGNVETGAIRNGEVIQRPLCVVRP